MDHYPAPFGFFDSVNAAGLEIKKAMLQFSEQVRQYQMDCITTELADCETATKQQKSPPDMAQSQKLQMDMAASQYARFINYWTGLNQLMLQGSTHMAMAVCKCGVLSTQRQREQTGAATPAMPEYMHAAMDAGIGYAMSNFEALQRYAMDNAHAVLDSTADHTVNGNGKLVKSEVHTKHNSRHGANGASA